MKHDDDNDDEERRVLRQVSASESFYRALAAASRQTRSAHFLEIEDEGGPKNATSARMGRPFLLRFEFGAFISLPREPGESVYSDEVIDDRGVGNAWRLQLFPGGVQPPPPDRGSIEGGDAFLSAFLHLTDGPDVVARTAFVVRDAYGRAFCEKSSEDVDTYAALSECHGYTSLTRRSDVLGEENAVLLRGALIVDVEVRPAGKPRRLV